MIGKCWQKLQNLHFPLWSVGVGCWVLNMQWIMKLLERPNMGLYLSGIFSVFSHLKRRGQTGGAGGARWWLDIFCWDNCYRSPGAGRHSAAPRGGRSCYWKMERFIFVWRETRARTLRMWRHPPGSKYFWHRSTYQTFWIFIFKDDKVRPPSVFPGVATKCSK